MPDSFTLMRRIARKALNRLVIQMAADQLFASRGFDDVTVAHVADLAGFSTKAVFRHFPTKEELAFARSPLLTAIVDDLKDRESGAGLLVTVARTTVRAAADPDVFARYPRSYGKSRPLQLNEPRLWARYEWQVAQLLVDEGVASPADALLLAMHVLALPRLAVESLVRDRLVGMAPEAAVAYLIACHDRAVSRLDASPRASGSLRSV